jgi:hypothetical protein
MNAPEKALEEYLYIVYDYDDRVAAGQVPDWYYFARSGYDAARVLVLNKQFHQAARLYERLAAAGIPTAAEAREKAREIRDAHRLN